MRHRITLRIGGGPPRGRRRLRRGFPEEASQVSMLVLVGLFMIGSGL